MASQLSAIPFEFRRWLCASLFAFAVLAFSGLSMPCAWADAQVEKPPEPALKLPSLDSLFESATRADHIGRILVPVLINSQGPYLFVLDTGANRSVLTPKLVELLKLPVEATDKVVMSGVTGTSSVPTVRVQQLQTGDIVLRNQMLPIADPLSPDVAGILGVDALEDTRVIVNFASGKIVIRKAHHEGKMDGLTRIPGQFRFGRLLVIKATVGRIPVKAVIDTGSQHTLANPALRQRLGLSKGLKVARETVVIGETLASQPGEIGRVPLIRMGGLQIIDPIVVFGDFYVFKLWHLDEEPALIIGMDLIGGLDTFVIDYQRGEVQIRVRELFHDPFDIKKGGASAGAAPDVSSDVSG